MTNFQADLERNVIANFYALAEEDEASVRVMVALSGGPDSVCLLRAMTSSKQIAVSACHVNHGLRLTSSRDEQFCRELCASLDVQLTVVNLDPATFKNQSEAVLRRHRYRALEAAAAKAMVSYVVSGHNLDDQIETMLFRLCRGTSSRGLTGIRGRRTLTPGLTIIRPMLNLSRAQISAYLSDVDQAFCLDETNDESQYTRNFLRNQILPPLYERFGAIEQSFEQLRQSCQVDEDYFAALTAQIMGQRRGRAIDISSLQNLHEALRGRVFVAMMEEAGVEPSYKRVQKLVEICAQYSSGSAITWSLGDGVDVFLSATGQLLLATGADDADNIDRTRAAHPAVSLRLPACAGETTNTIVPWLDCAIRIEALPGSSLPSGSSRTMAFPHRQAHAAYIDLRRVSSDLIFRLRCDGDCIQPLGMDRLVRLKKYLHVNKNESVPGQKILRRLGDQLARRLTPVLCAGSEVIWVPGFGLSEKVKIEFKSSSEPESESESESQSELNCDNAAAPLIYHVSLVELAYNSTLFAPGDLPDNSGLC